MKITSDLLNAGVTAAGGYTKPQLALLGVDWPPVNGWKASVIGLEISDDLGEEFIRLGGRSNSDRKIG